MKSKIVKCVDCGKELPRKELNRHFRCKDCSWKAVIDAVHNLTDKRGPYYEKWKQGIKTAISKP